MKIVNRCFRGACITRAVGCLLSLLLPVAVHAQYDYSITNGTVTITKYTGPNGAVVVPSSISGLPVTVIGDLAFWPNDGLTGVTIPNSVTSIGRGAFSATGLSMIAVPSSVTNIGDSCFENCASLTNISLPDTITRIGAQTFLWCGSLRGLIVPNSVVDIGDFAFASSGLASLALPPSVLSLGQGVFANCQNLLELGVAPSNPAFSALDGVVLNKSQTVLVAFPCGRTGTYLVAGTILAIGDYAFTHCQLSGLTISGSVTSIGNRAFENSGKLTTITIPDSVTNIGDYAFCSSHLRAVTIGKNTARIGDRAFLYCSLTNLALPEGLVSIGARAFQYCGYVTNVIIPRNVTWMGSAPFAGSGLKAITVDALNPAYTSVDGVVFDKQMTALIEYPGAKGPSYYIPQTVTSIEDGAFALCNVNDVSLPGDLLNIGDEAFYDCPLASVTLSLPNTVTNIGNSAFSGCHLAGVTLPANLVRIGDKAFSGCALAGIVLPSALTTIGSYAFAGCSGLSAVVIPNGVTELGDGAFSWCSSLTNISLPGSLSRIGDSTFYKCASLVNVTISQGVTNIGAHAFEECTSLPNAILPDTVASIGNYAFYNCTVLGSAMIPRSVTHIGTDVLYGCKNLRAITVDPLNPAYSSAGGVLFNKAQTLLLQYPCGKTGGYTIPGGVTNVADFAFSRCGGLTSVAITEGVLSMGQGAFYGCTGLASVWLPNSLTTLGEEAFSGCSSLATARLGNDTVSLGKQAFSHCYALSSVTLESKLVSIGNEAFSGCRSLSTVVIPDSVVSIGDWAFCYCNLTAVNLSSNTTVIGDGAFACDHLSGITVDALNPAYKSVDGVVFDKAGATLTVFPTGRSGNYVVPNGVTNIGRFAFCICEGLTGITFPEGLANIDEGAFESCIGLLNITIPANVAHVGQRAFGYCAQMRGIWFRGNAPAFASEVFTSNSSTVYYLPGMTGWGSLCAGRPALLWNPQIQPANPRFGLPAKPFGFNVVGTPGIPIVIEATPTWSPPTWAALQPLTLSTNGLAQFTDANWEHFGARFYRVRSP